MRSRILLSVVVLTTFTVCKADPPPDEGRTPKPDEPGDKKNPLARGWGDSIEWVELEAGIEIAKAEKKPLMLIIHKTWCGACQSLKGKFAKAKMIAELAKKFVMVNAEDDEEPWEEEYYPDGGKYIPRILFVSPEGEVLKDIINPKDEFKQYPYYYSNPAPIIHAMQNVLKKFGLDGKEDSKKSEAKETVSENAPQKSAESEPEAPESREGEKAKKDKDGKKKAELPRKSKKVESEDGEPRPPSQTPPKKEL